MKYLLQTTLKCNLLNHSLLFLFIGLLPFIMNAQDFSQLYSKLNPSVVTILTGETVFSKGAVSKGSGLGSGVIIDKEGLIMTAAHVVASAEKIVVKFYNNEMIEAEVISSVAGTDVALIKLKSIPKNMPVAEMGNSDLVKIGEQILIIGAPFGLEHSLSIGHISAKQQRGEIISGQKMEFFQTDAAINTGNSGGPIFNVDGKVIGIVSSILTKSGGFDGIGFAAAINPTKKILLESSPFWTGFEGLFFKERLAQVFNVPAKGGMLVQRVVHNSMAEKAGLKGGWLKATILGQEIWVGGDIILSVEQISCNSPHNFQSIKTQIEKLSTNENIHMTVLRAGKIHELTMEFK